MKKTFALWPVGQIPLAPPSRLTSRKNSLFAAGEGSVFVDIPNKWGYKIQKVQLNDFEV